MKPLFVLVHSDRPGDCAHSAPRALHCVSTISPRPDTRLRQSAMKRLPQADADAPDEGEELPPKRPRARFAELQPAAEDPADGIDEEIPGSARADVKPLVLSDAPFRAHPGGGAALTASHATDDPGFARAQRAHLRSQRQDQGALGEALQAQERYDQPQEARNEVGQPVEPFHLKRELEEGAFDPAGGYIEYERPEQDDAWLDSLEGQVQGVGPDRGRRLPQANEPVAEPTPLAGAQLAPYWRCALEVLQPGETVPAALRRLAGGGPVLDKFGSREEARQFFQERVRSGHAVPPANHPQFVALTEAAEVLFDAGRTGIYSETREQLAARLRKEQAAELAPPEAAPSARAAAEVAAQFGGGGTEEEAEEGEGVAAAGPGRLRRHHEPPPAGPAAAAEPAVAPGMPSVPGSQRKAATTRSGAGVGAAAHGFAADVAADLMVELPGAAPPPQAMEAWLGLPTSAPTAQELQGQQQLELSAAQAAREQLLQRLAAQPVGTTPEQQAAVQAALQGSYAVGVPALPLGPVQAEGAQAAAQQPQKDAAPIALNNEDANLAPPAGGTEE